MKVEVESFKTADGGDTLSIKPSDSRRKPNWYVWMKEDGSGILVINSDIMLNPKMRVDLPANS